MQQADDRVNITTGQHHPCDRRRSQSVARVQTYSRLDLQAQIGRGIQNEPITVVRRYRKRRLRACTYRTVTRPRTPAGRSVRIPLWKTAAGSRSEDNREDHRVASPGLPASADQKLI
jgi:hypothetical protein